MNNILMQQFIQLISNNTGLHIREQDRPDFCKKIYARMKLLNLSVPEQYYQLLNIGKSHNFSGENLPGSEKTFLAERECEREWTELTRQLTIGESYFFRDRGQFALLKNRILPQLIEQKKKACYSKGEAKPSLRIWSAGCSTGEEPYSLAILVKELIPDLLKWNILILGTDINPEAIEKAKQGFYDSWSFRLVDPDLRMRYFTQHKKTWEVNEPIRNMVTFRSLNLIKDCFASSTSDIYNVDIILCRNVFIYFDSKAISLVLEKFYNTLQMRGFLITGHAELHGQNLGGMQAISFPESVVYQRSELQVETPLTRHIPSYDLLTSKTLQKQPEYPKKHMAPKESATSSSTFLTRSNLNRTTSQTVLGEAETLFHNGAYTSVLKETEQVIKEQPHHFDAYYLMAQALANLGEWAKAIQCCHQALKIDSLSLQTYYLLTHIAEEQGEIEQAKSFLKKIIYLAPSSIAAYLELGSLYESEGDKTRAIKMRTAAFELLKKLPPHAIVEHLGEITSGELITQVKKLMANWKNTNSN